jgi:hypothetical protein
MVSRRGLSWLILIAKSSKEQDGYERTSDTSGARLCQAPEGHLDRNRGGKENTKSAFGFKGSDEKVA